MDKTITKVWGDILKNELEKPYFKELKKEVYSKYNENICYPKYNDIFNALNLCDFSQIKIVIIGQDPYHGEMQANGLCFSVNKGVAIPRSLTNIFKEIKNNNPGYDPKNGCLEHWAKQGVLMLNSVLTVEKGKANSHKNIGWETFTSSIIDIVSEQKKNVVFMLWGGYAHKKGKQINIENNLILKSGHPSPLSANRGFWFGNNHFEKANE